MPLAIDMFCGLGGWSEGLLAEGWDVVGFDIERHAYGDMRYPAQLVLQDVTTIHGSQFRDADLIVASPPCQNYSYLAMPWSRSRGDGSPKAKAMRRKWETEGPDNRLFDACFRIQREACEAAAGRYIPLIVENVRGAEPWVGPAKWKYGSFYLWGDVPALMPMQGNRKNTGGSWFGVRGDETLDRNDPRDLRRDESGEFVDASVRGGWNHPGKALDGTKNTGGSWFEDRRNNPRTGSRNQARKAASAMIAKIPLPLSRYIARHFRSALESGPAR